MARFELRVGLRGSTTTRRAAIALATAGFGLAVSPTVARADVITDVNNAMLNIIQYTSGAMVDGPPEVAREIAIVDGAMYNAVNAAGGSGVVAQAAALQAAISVMSGVSGQTGLYGTGSLYQQYQGVTGAQYYGVGGTVPNATYATQYAGVPIGPSNTQMAAVAGQIASIQTELNGLGGGAAVTTGSAIGASAAAAKLAAQTGDGSNAANLATIQTPYTAPASPQPGNYIPPSGRPAMTPTWGTVTPIGTDPTTLTNLTNKVPAPPDVTSQAYATVLLRTQCEGGITPAPQIASACAAAGFTPQTALQAKAALFWNDPGTTAQPPGHWVQIADTVAGTQGLGLLQHALEDSLLGIALNDAGIAVWDVKYANLLWRPTTAIQDCANWNTYFTTCQSNWASLIATPPHPDYVAGHPGFSGAAATLLDNFFGPTDIAFTSTSQAYCNGGTTLRDANANLTGCVLNSVTYLVSNPSDCNNADTQAPLLSDYTANPLYNKSPLICALSETFTSFDDASAGDSGSTFSRVAGGIHTDMAVLNALSLGNAIGEQVASDNNIPEPGSLALLTLSLAAVGVMRRRSRHVAAVATA